MNKKYHRMSDKEVNKTLNEQNERIIELEKENRRLKNMIALYELEEVIE